MHPRVTRSRRSVAGRDQRPPPPPRRSSASSSPPSICSGAAFEIVERNYRTRWGELDIVAFDGRTLAFCEVKTPAGDARPAAARSSPCTSRKRAQVRKMAGRWLIDRADRPRADVLRFDAIGVTFDAGGRLLELEHLEGAF